MKKFLKCRPDIVVKVHVLNLIFFWSNKKCINQYLPLHVVCQIPIIFTFSFFL